MLAQAQESFYQKASRDKKNPAVLARCVHHIHLCLCFLSMSLSQATGTRSLQSPFLQELSIFAMEVPTVAGRLMQDRIVFIAWHADDCKKPDACAMRLLSASIKEGTLLHCRLAAQVSQYYKDIEELDSIQQLRKYLGQVTSSSFNTHILHPRFSPHTSPTYFPTCFPTHFPTHFTHILHPHTTATCRICWKAFYCLP